MSELLSTVPTLTAQTSVEEETVAIVAARQERNLSKLASGTHEGSEGLVVSPNSVGLASYDEAVVVTNTAQQLHRRSKSSSSGEGKNSDLNASAMVTSELKLSHERILNLQKAVMEREKALKRRKREVSKVSEELEREKYERQRKEVELRAMTDDLQAAKSQLQELDAVHRSIVIKYNSVKGELEDAHARIEKLEENLEAKDSLREKSERQYKSLRDDFQCAVRNYDLRVAELTKLNKCKSDEIEELRKINEAERNAKIPEKIKGAEEDNLMIPVALKRQLEDQLKRKDELIAIKDKDLIALEETLRELENKHEEASRNEAILKQQLQKSEAQQQQIIQANIGLKQVVQALEMRVMRTTTVNNEYNNLHATSAYEPSSSDEELLGEIEEQRGDNRRLRNELSKQRMELKSERDRVRSLSTEKRATEAKLMGEQERAKSESNRRLDAEKARSRGERRNFEMASALRETKEDLSKSEAEVVLLRRRIDSLNEAACNLQVQMDKSRKEAEVVREKLAKAEAASVDAKTAADRKQRETDLLQTALEDAAGQIDSIKKEKEDGLRNLEQECRKSISLARDRLAQLEHDFVCERRAGKVLEETLAEVESDLNMAGHLNRWLRDNGEQMKITIKMLQERESHLSRCLDRSLARQSSVNSSLVSCKSRCQRLEEELQRADRTRERLEGEVISLMVARLGQKGVDVLGKERISSHLY